MSFDISCLKLLYSSVYVLINLIHSVFNILFVCLFCSIVSLLFDEVIRRFQHLTGHISVVSPLIWLYWVTDK